MDWDKCRNPDCYASAHGYTPSRCSNPECGSPRFRCSSCKKVFVENIYDVCDECIQKGITCDNCLTISDKLYRTHLDELWCFSCLEFYNETGPALPINQEILRLEKEEQKAFYNESNNIDANSLDNAKVILERRRSLRSRGYSGENIEYTKRCVSCKFPIPKRDNPRDNNYCFNCLTLIGNHVCTECFEDLDPIVGCDELGQCINCSTRVVESNYAYGIGGGKTYKHFTDYTDDVCINCRQEFINGDTRLCNKCLKKYQVINEQE